MRAALYLLIFSTVLLSSCFLLKNRHCKDIDEASLSRIAEEQIAKGIMSGDTSICGYHLTWTAKKGLNKIEVSKGVRKNNPLQVKNECSYTAVTMKKDTIPLCNANYESTMVIFANNYSCLQCFNTVNKWIENEAIDTSRVFVVVLGRVGIENLNRRGLINQLTPLISYSKGYLFDLQEEQDVYPPTSIQEGVYGKYKISKTPAVLVCNNRTHTEELFLPYEKLFDKEGGITESSSKLLLKAVGKF
jgi:hypothetical protein